MVPPVMGAVVATLVTVPAFAVAPSAMLRSDCTPPFVMPVANAGVPLLSSIAGAAVAVAEVAMPLNLLRSEPVMMAPEPTLLTSLSSVTLSVARMTLAEPCFNRLLAVLSSHNVLASTTLPSAAAGLLDCGVISSPVGSIKPLTVNLPLTMSSLAAVSYESVVSLVKPPAPSDSCTMPLAPLEAGLMVPLTMTFFQFAPS